MVNGNKKYKKLTIHPETTDGRQLFFCSKRVISVSYTHLDVYKRQIYGMGHAIYSVSDPRAEVLKGFVESLAKEKGRMKDYRLYSMVEWLSLIHI